LHGTENLDVGDRVEAETTWIALAAELDAFGRPILRGLRLDEPEIRFLAACRLFGHFTSTDPVGVDDTVRTPRRKPWTNAAYHAGAEIVLDAFGCRWQGRRALIGLELKAVRGSVNQTPTALMNSPAVIEAAWPTNATRSRCPRASTFRIAMPFAAL